MGRIETAYDALGHRQTVTQFDSSGASGGTVLDQAGFSYDGWGNLASYRQDVDSAFGESGDDEYEVSYTWAKATSGRASLRRTGITLPSGASVSLDYRSVSGRFDDAVSRVTSLTHGATVAVAYDYLGLGQVVATDYPEPEIRWRLYEGNTTGDYTDLDRFGRVVHSRWTKYGELPFGMSPPNIYHVELDGDGLFTGTDEWDDCREHNDVNEILKPNLDCDTAEVDLAYDAAGNLIDDGKDYKYVYDAFYRLRFIKTQGDDVVSEHRYNGLGHRIAVHADTDGDVDGSDTWVHLAYDERWRLVARYWAGDTDPHEQYLHHQAGLDGHGGSSYIDLVALRDRDTDDNGSLDERIYYCQNWRADVPVLVSSSAELLKWVKYSAYGVPFGLPAGDADSDGTRDSADRIQIAAWASAPAYDVRGDLNLDGLVNSTDLTLASGDVGMGRGVFVLLGNVLGWAGGEHVDGVSSAVRFRNRVMLSSMGRWGRRDPLFLGAMDSEGGINLYQGHMSRAIVLHDPYGLSTIHLACDASMGPNGQSGKPGACADVGTEVRFQCKSGRYWWKYQAFDADYAKGSSERLCRAELRGPCIPGTEHIARLSCKLCCGCGNQEVCRVHGNAGADDDDGDGCAEVTFVGQGFTGGEFSEDLDEWGTSTAEHVAVGTALVIAGVASGGAVGGLLFGGVGIAFTIRNPSGQSMKVCCPMNDCPSKCAGPGGGGSGGRGEPGGGSSSGN